MSSKKKTKLPAKKSIAAKDKRKEALALKVAEQGQPVVFYAPTLVDIALNLRQDLQADMKALNEEKEAAKEKQANIEREMLRVDGGLATLTVLLGRIADANSEDAK